MTPRARTLRSVGAIRNYQTGVSMGERAKALGHIPDVIEDGKRFVLVCSCGYRTHANWTRRHTFEAITQHVIDVVNTSEEDRRVAPPLSEATASVRHAE